MAITVYCTNCNHQFQVADQLEGKQGRCPGCRVLLQFPRRAQAASKPGPAAKRPLPQARAISRKPQPDGAAKPKAAARPKTTQPASASGAAASAQPAAKVPAVRKKQHAEGKPASPAEVPVARTIAVGRKAKGSPTGKAPASPTLSSQPAQAPTPSSATPGSVKSQSVVASTPSPGLLAAAAAGPGRQPSRHELQQKILSGLEGSIDDVELTGDYRFGMFLVASVMVALVMTYLLLVAGAGIFIAWYLKFALDTFRQASASGGGAAVLALFHLVPLAAAGLIFFALLRPLFGRFAGDERTRTITRESDPLVFAFVERIAAAVGAPMPSRIDVNTDVNASAGFPVGLFRSGGNELILTLGLSLVAGLNTRQFAGVLAHELGHFTQKSSIRMTALVARISMWFSHAADSDYWDARFAHLTRNLDNQIAFFLHAFRLILKVPQWLLRGLLMLAYLVCGYMFRQREFDADRFETRVCGSACFESTTRRLEVLGIAFRRSIDQLQFGYEEGRLGDNLPLLVLSNTKQIPKKVHKALRKHVEESKTMWIDSHPCPKERIENAWKEQTSGIYRVELPAHLLFSNFLGLARNATWDFYRGIFGSKFRQSEMHPIGDLLERIDQEEKASKTLRRYFQGTFTTLRPIRLKGSSVSEPANINTTVNGLRNSRQSVVASAEAHRAVVKRFDEADTQAFEAIQARALLRAGFRIGRDKSSVAARNVNQANDIHRQARARMEAAGRELQRYEEASSIRLWTALQLMHVERVADRLEDSGKLQDECHKLVDALAFLNGKTTDLFHLRDSHAALRALFMQLRGHSRNQRLIREILREAKDVFEHLARLRESLSMIVYPFDHAKGRVTMADYALETMPDRENPFHIYDAAEQFGMAMSSFYPRLAGRLAMMAERVEGLLGMEPLAEPPEEDDEEDSTKSE